MLDRTTFETERNLIIYGKSLKLTTTARDPKDDSKGTRDLGEYPTFVSFSVVVSPLVHSLHTASSIAGYAWSNVCSSPSSKHPANVVDLTTAPTSTGILSTF
jgi:hypothetical protein